MSPTRRDALRAVLASLCAVAPGVSSLARRAHAFGDVSLFDIPLLRYDSPSWNPRPSAIVRLLLEIEATTSISVASEAGEIEPTSDALLDSPIVMLGGDTGFEPWSEEARAAMATWLGAGGLLVIDSSEGVADGEFDRCIRREVAAFLPESPMERIPDDHVLFKSFYLIDGAPGRLAIQAHMEGVTWDDRLAVVYSVNDMMGAWAKDNFGGWEFECHPGGERQRSMAYRMGVNLAMYALCLDYKEDQVHVPFIMRRRQWRVE